MGGVAGEFEIDYSARSNYRCRLTCIISIGELLTLVYQLHRVNLRIGKKYNRGVLIGKVMIEIRAKFYEEPMVGHAYEPVGRAKAGGDEPLEDQQTDSMPARHFSASRTLAPQVRW